MQSDSPPFLLHARFAERARRAPGATALLCGEDSISCADLQERAERAADALRAVGVGPGAVVGLHAERSIPWVVGLLAILRAGGAVVPLPPSYPLERLRALLAFARLDAVVDAEATALPASLPTRTLRLEDLVAAGSPGGVSEAGDPEAPAFILASSGSTGHPKLIVRSHRSFFHRLGWMWATHPYAADEVCCQKAHLTTTHAVYELFEPLLGGTPVVIVPDDEVRDLEGFWDTVRTRGVTRLLLVPSVLRASLDMPGFAPPPLRLVVLMGEYVPPGLAERAVAAFPAGTELVSIYGSTEASSTLLCDLRADFRPGEELPLGRPLTSDVRPHVLGPDRTPVAPGGEGRLFMEGSPLFAGYFRDPEQTDSVLVEAPGRPGLLFDTRDQVRLRPDGSLEFLGRVDETVKVRGFRVDLPEVERALLAHPGVTQAAVVADEAGDGSSRLLAFHVPASVERSNLYATLRDRLPEYMLPAAVFGLDALPLTASHKVDRVRLLEEGVARERPTRPGRALSEAERRVAAEWERVLGRPAPGPDVSFFEAGGTSLLVFALVHRLREAFGLDRERLPEPVVYRAPTIAAQAALLGELRSGRGPAVAGVTPILVTLRAARNGGDRAPLFLVSSAGGTLGAYERLAAAVETPQEILGIRDPYIWGERDPAEGFDAWVARYVEAIRERQATGPYFVVAYSSAGAFGLEIARRLRAMGEEVALLALVDPLALARGGRDSFGWWALRATWLRPPLRALVRLAGRLREPALRRIGTPEPEAPETRLSREELARASEEALRSPGHLASLSALFELNSGLPFTLTEADFEGVEPDRRLDVFAERVRERMPEVERESLERIVIQYGLQIRAQHSWRPSRYEGRVLLVEPRTPYAGLTASLLRPYLRDLRAVKVPLGTPSDRVREITARFGALVPHYRSMRDETFVAGLARELDAELER